MCVYHVFDIGIIEVIKSILNFIDYSDSYTFHFHFSDRRFHISVAIPMFIGTSNIVRVCHSVYNLYHK